MFAKQPRESHQSRGESSNAQEYCHDSWQQIQFALAASALIFISIFLLLSYDEPFWRGRTRPNPRRWVKPHRSVWGKSRIASTQSICCEEMNLLRSLLSERWPFFTIFLNWFSRLSLWLGERNFRRNSLLLFIVSFRRVYETNYEERGKLELENFCTANGT